MHRITDYVAGVSTLIADLPKDPILSVAQTLTELHARGATIFVCGNGGSAATASHFALDLAKGTRPPEGVSRVRAVALTDSTPLLSAWANDTHYATVFEEQLATWYREGDGLVAISGSGNSANVLRAVEYVNAKGGPTLALTGYSGGKLASIASRSIIVPSDDLEKIEDCHLVLCHLFTAYLRSELSAQ